MRTKLKLLIVGVIFISGNIILMFGSTYESNAIVKSSVVSCEPVTANNYRGLNKNIKQKQNEFEITYLNDYQKNLEYYEVKEKDANVKLAVKQETKKEKPIYNWTTEYKVNLRTKDEINSKIISSLDKRSKVEVISKNDDWTKIKFNDKTGYICSKYLRDTELPKIDFTPENIDLLAKILYWESRGESDEGNICVLIVIENRVMSKEFPDDLFHVLSQKDQFSSWGLLSTAKPSEKQYELIEEWINGSWDGLLDNEYVYFSTSPRNNNGTIKIGNHFFCKQDTK